MTRRTKGALLAAACAGGGAAIWTLAFHFGHAARFDGRLLDAFRERGLLELGPISTARIQAIVDPKPFLLASELLIAVALVRRRPAMAAAVAGILGCANITSQVLKPLLAEPRGWSVDPSAWPSGHATAAMTLALCAVLLAPRRWRPVAAAGSAVFALGVGGSLLVEGVHFPSDVIGGYLIAGAWTGLAVVALDRTRARGAVVEWSLVASRAAAVAATGLAASLAIWQADQLSRFAVDNTKFVVVAAAIAASTAALLVFSRLPRGRPIA